MGQRSRAGISQGASPCLPGCRVVVESHVYRARRCDSASSPSILISAPWLLGFMGYYYANSYWAALNCRWERRVVLVAAPHDSFYSEAPYCGERSKVGSMILSLFSQRHFSTHSSSSRVSLLAGVCDINLVKADFGAGTLLTVAKGIQLVASECRLQRRSVLCASRKGLSMNVLEIGTYRCTRISPHATTFTLTLVPTTS